MIDLAIAQLQQKIETNLPYIDLVGGVARQQKITVGDRVKTLPATPDADNPGAYLWLTPNTERSGILYFEVLRSGNPERLAGGSAYGYTATVRAVVWLNMQRLSPSAAAPLIMAQVVSNLQGRHTDAYPVTNIRVWPEGEAVKGPELFSKYTYDEAESQFLMLPFEYFAFDFTLSFALASDCVLDNVLKTSAAC